jgi:hypothetical protein
MKKILLGLVAVFALASVAPVYAGEEGAAGGDAPKAEKKGGKKKKGKKGEGDAAGGGDAGGDAAKK